MKKRKYRPLLFCFFSVTLLSCSQSGSKPNSASQGLPPHVAGSLVPAKTAVVKSKAGQALKVRDSSIELDSAAVTSEMSSFFPKGLVVLQAFEGNLNLDSIPDRVLVLKNPKESANGDSYPRPVLLFTGNESHTWTLAGRNDQLVYGATEGGMMGDPFTGVSIKKGYVSFEHYGGSSQRWTRVMTFKFDRNARTWFLYKDGSETFSAFDPENSKDHVKTVRDFGRISFAKFNNGN